MKRLAERIIEYMRLLATFGPYATWLMTAKTRASASVPVEARKEWIAGCLRAIGDTSMPDLGFSLDVWNGEHATLRFTVGAFSQHVTNAVVLSHGPRSTGAERAELEGALNATICAFSPEHAVVTSSEYMKRAGVKKPWEAGLFYV